MKLEKREITLNEKDSLRDVLYLETLLYLAYTDETNDFRQETKNVLSSLEKESFDEKTRVEKLYKNA